MESIVKTEFGIFHIPCERERSAPVAEVLRHFGRAHFIGRLAPGRAAKGLHRLGFLALRELLGFLLCLQGASADLR